MLRKNNNINKYFSDKYFSDKYFSNKYFSDKYFSDKYLRNVPNYIYNITWRKIPIENKFLYTIKTHIKETKLIYKSAHLSKNNIKFYIETEIKYKNIIDRAIDIDINILDYDYTKINNDVFHLLIDYESKLSKKFITNDLNEIFFHSSKIMNDMNNYLINKCENNKIKKIKIISVKWKFINSYYNNYY